MQALRPGSLWNGQRRRLTNGCSHQGLGPRLLGELLIPMERRCVAPQAHQIERGIAVPPTASAEPRQRKLTQISLATSPT